MSNNRKPVIVAVGVFVLLLLSGAILLLTRSKPDIFTPGTASSTPGATGEGTPQPTGTQGDKYGIDVQLREGRPQLQAAEVLPVATGEPLFPRRDRIDPGASARADACSRRADGFNLPQEVLPPPRPGETIKETFPPLETEPTPGAVEAGPLQVLRFAPEGEIPIAPFVSVTFNQPMVPLGTLGDLAAEDVPVQDRAIPARHLALAGHQDPDL